MRKFFIASVIALICTTVGAQDISNTIAATVKYGKLPAEQITVAQVQKMLNTQKQIGDTTATPKIALDKLIDIKLVSLAAKNDGFSVSDEVINAQLSSQYYQVMLQLQKTISQQEFAQIIQTKTGMTMEAYLASMREQLLPVEYVKFKKKETLDKIPKPTDAQIVDYYNSNQKDFFMTENVTVQHILFTVDSNMTADQKKEVLNRAESVYKEIISGKKTFEEAVSLYSEHVSSKKNSGTWTVLFRDDSKAKESLGAAFFNQCFELEVNKVSPVITSEYGYHIVRITNKTPSGLMGLDAEVTKGSGKTIRKQISDSLYNKSLEANFLVIYQDYVKTLRKDLNATIIVDDLALSMVSL